MKVALISAPAYSEVAFVNTFISELLYKSETRLPPIGLLYIASYLEKEGHEVKIFNITAFPYTIADIIEDLKQYGAQIVGFSISSNSFLLSLDIIKEVKIQLELPIIVGGPHVTIFKEQLLNFEEINFAIPGEGEIIMADLVNAIENEGDLSKIKGLIFKDQSGNVIVNEDRPVIQDLDELLYPAYHLIDFDQYNNERFGNERFTIGFITRGCPYNCNFCSKITKKFRTRSVDNVIKEITWLYNQFGIKNVHFWDDTFTFSKKWTLKFCNEIKKLPFKFQYSCFTRVDKIDKETLQALKDSGCIQVCYGIESFDKESLKTMNKHTTPAMIQRAINDTIAVDMRFFSMFIFGVPGDTKQSLKNSIDFIMNTDLELIQIRPLMLMPNTQFYDDHLKKGGKDFWSEVIKGRKVKMDDVHVDSNFSKEEIDQIIRKTLLKYYLRPTKIWHLYRKKLGKFGPKMYVKGFLSILTMFFQFF